MKPQYAGVDWRRQKKTYSEGTPHTAAATYHYIATYTIWLRSQMLWPQDTALLVGDYLGLLYMHILSAKHVQMLVIHRAVTGYIAVKSIDGCV